MQSLELPTAESTRECLCKERSFPAVARGEEVFQVSVRIRHRFFPEPRQARNRLDWILHFELREKVMQDNAIRVKRGSRIKPPLPFATRETLDVFRSHFPSVLLRGDTLTEEFKDVVILLGQWLPKRFDVREKLLDGLLQSLVVFFVGQPQKLKIILPGL